MNVLMDIEKKINLLKIVNQEAGNMLHNHLHYIITAPYWAYTKEELREYLKVENDPADALDNSLADFDNQVIRIRAIQDAMIYHFGS